MNLYYNGTDIYNDISLNYCVHEMHAEKQADTLVLRFNDTKGVWSKWNPAEGDEIRFKEGASDTGKMFIHFMRPENGLFTVRAMSMPKTGKTKKSKSWEGVRFLQIANEIARAHGLTFQNYFGMLGHCATYGLQKWIEKNIIFKRKDGEVTTWTQ